MNRNRILLLVLVLGAAALLLIPFGRRGRSVHPLPDAKQSQLAPLVSYIEENYKTPTDYVVTTFANHNIVFLGEYGKIRQNVELVQRLIPLLYKQGVRNLGIEYALSSDQSLIDRLTTGATYDESLAKKILFDYLVIWGYQEYAGIFKAAWSFNRSLPVGAPPFRVVGLNVAENWQYIKTKQDASNPAVLHKVFANGIPDEHMASLIEKRFVAAGEKALIYLNTRSAFTRYESPGYSDSMRKMGFTQTQRVGNIIYDKIGQRSFTILLHQPWPSSKNQSGETYPVDGVIDNVIARLPPDRREAGFDVEGTVFAGLRLGNSDFSAKDSSTTFGNVCDGYVIQGRLSDYRPVAPIPDFINQENLQTALREFPGPKVENLEPSNLNQFIASNLGQLGRFLSTFK